MFTFVMAQRLGLQSDLTLGLSLLEGVLLTIALMLLAERYLFSKPPVGARVEGAALLAATGDARQAPASPTEL